MERKRRSKGPVSDDLTEKEISGLEQQLGLSEVQIVDREAEVLEQRARFYTCFESCYQVRTDSIKMGKPREETTHKLVYYKLADLLTLLTDCNSQPSNLLSRELRAKDNGIGEINRERAVSSLETRGLAERKDYVGKVIAYATKKSSSK